MIARFDAIVVGLGAMGSATVHELARRGQHMLGVDRFSPPHALGSSHGRSRIIREAYFEHPLYVPLLRRAYERWEELERDSGRTLLRRTGGLMIGPAGGALVPGARASAEEHGVPHELLGAADVRRRFPALRPSPGMVALLESRAGVLFAEQIIETFLALARRHGAELRTGETVERWSAGPSGVSITTNRGVYEGERLVLAAGPWIGALLADLALPLEIERQIFHWFSPARDAPLFHPDRCPIALWETEEGCLFVTFPDLGNGVKIGIHHQGELTSPDAVRRDVSESEDARVRALLERFLPAASGSLLEHRVCLYTNTPDHHFVIDHHPAERRVVIASPCSGHGFKFASVIGEIAADLALAGRTRFDLSPFSVARLKALDRLPAARPDANHRTAH